MPSNEMKKEVIRILGADINKGDVTSALLPAKKCKAIIKINEDSIIAGVEEAKFLFESKGCKVKALAKDGQTAKKRKAILEIEGNNKKILETERTALNILGRMSGVANICNETKKSIPNFRGKLALTRKTMPGFNLFDKKAAKIAGIYPHRINLNDMVLIKENHLEFLNIADALKNAKKNSKGKKVEIEVKNLKEALEAAKWNPDYIMLDNFNLRNARKTIEELRKKFSGKIELSGGINLKNLQEYAELQPDLISSGFLTKNAKMVDFSLDIKK